jgi:hypothetical protein
MTTTPRSAGSVFDRARRGVAGDTELKDMRATSQRPGINNAHTTLQH